LADIDLGQISRQQPFVLMYIKVRVRHVLNDQGAPPIRAARDVKEQLHVDW
jgi:hypothetical protein